MKTENAPTQKLRLPLRSTTGMHAKVIYGKRENGIAIPAGMTMDEIRSWLETNGYTNEFWKLNGIYETVGWKDL